MKDYFLSFGTKGGNCGVVVTSADSCADALAKVTLAGLNPASPSVAIYEIEKVEADQFVR